MKTAAATMILSALAAPAFASPIAVERAQMCNVAPAAGGNAQPISQPGAATADACQKACVQNTACQSFVFGLPASASAPSCKLFSVPAAQAPGQGANLHVFDKACTSVPVTQPTHAQPFGAASKAGGGAPKQQPRANPPPKQPVQPAPQPPQPTPPKPSPKPPAPAPQPKGGKRANAEQGQAPAQSGANSTPGKSSATSAAPATNQVCGAAPTGPATSTPSPFRTDASVTSQADCLVLCHDTNGCKSCEFGQSVSGGPKQCLLFSVAASALPAPTSGQSLVAFDTGC